MAVSPIHRLARSRVDHWARIVERWADRHFRSIGIEPRLINPWLAVVGERDDGPVALPLAVGAPRRRKTYFVACAHFEAEGYAVERRAVRCAARAIAVREAWCALRGRSNEFYGADGSYQPLYRQMKKAGRA